MCGMNEVHLTNASIPGVTCLRENKASTIKRRRDTIYTITKIDKAAYIKYTLCRKNQEKLTRVDNVLISKYQSISSPGWLSVSEVAYNFDQV